MDEIPEFDYEKLNAMTHRRSRDNWLNFGSNTFSSVTFVLAAIYSEAIAGYFGVSAATVILFACIPMAVYLIWWGLTWRGRHQESLAYVNALYELQAHCRELERIAKNKVTA